MLTARAGLNRAATLRPAGRPHTRRPGYYLVAHSVTGETDLVASTFTTGPGILRCPGRTAPGGILPGRMLTACGSLIHLWHCEDALGNSGDACARRRGHNCITRRAALPGKPNTAGPESATGGCAFRAADNRRLYRAGWRFR